jgi:hypothetical protein
MPSHHTRIRRIWQSMKARCEKPGNMSYRRYGGRGIRVCTEWQDFATFRDWAFAHGYTDDLTLERIDNDGGYTPENCKWIPLRQQWENTHRTIRVTCWGETKALPTWIRDERCTVSYQVAFDRIVRMGWQAEPALTLLPDKHRSRPRRQKPQRTIVVSV